MDDNTTLTAPEAAGPQLPVSVRVNRIRSLRRFLAKRKERRATAPDPEPARNMDNAKPEPASKKAKTAVSDHDEEDASTWLSLGSLTTYHARAGNASRSP
ncbi:hypothetical protein EJB05_07810, partial [Eragrostis curvula]